MMQEGDLTPSFNELAKRAAVGVGTVYRHFADHQELLAGVAEADLNDVGALTARAVAEKDPLVALDVLVRGAVTFALDSPVIAQLLAPPQRESRESRKLVRQFAEFEAAGETILARGRKAKLIRTDLRPGDLGRLLCGLDRAIRGGDEPREAAVRYVDIVLAGLRRPH